MLITRVGPAIPFPHVHGRTHAWWQQSYVIVGAAAAVAAAVLPPRLGAKPKPAQNETDDTEPPSAKHKRTQNKTDDAEPGVLRSGKNPHGSEEGKLSRVGLFLVAWLTTAARR